MIKCQLQTGMINAHCRPADCLSKSNFKPHLAHILAGFIYRRTISSLLVNQTNIETCKAGHSECQFLTCWLLMAISTITGLQFKSVSGF